MLDIIINIIGIILGIVFYLFIIGFSCMITYAMIHLLVIKYFIVKFTRCVWFGYLVESIIMLFLCYFIYKHFGILFAVGILVMHFLFVLGNDPDPELDL